MKSLVILFSSLAVVAGCSFGSSSESTPVFDTSPTEPTEAGASSTCMPYVVPSTTDLTTPKISFKNDVFPFLSASCSISTSCHSSSNNGVSFGDTDPSTMLNGLVAISAPELVTMNLVQPTDPTNSFLMRKLDGDQCLLDAKCGGSCQESMPQASDLAPLETRDTVRRWIAQGALDN